MYKEDIEYLEGSAKDLQKEYKELKEIIKACRTAAESVNAAMSSALKHKSKNLFKDDIATLFHSAFGYSNYQNSGAHIGKLLASIFSARSSGGNVSNGIPYVVGEKGPEIFTPNNSGRILPRVIKNKKNGHNIVLNIHTEDGESFKRSKAQILSELAMIVKNTSKL